MPQYHELNNHYQINDVAGWPALFKRLQESSGQPEVDFAHEYCYDVGGVADPRHFYDIRIQGTDTDGVATRWLIVNLGGKELINDPMHNLRSAEELIETMMTLRQHNLGKIPELINTGMPDDSYLAAEAQVREQYRTQMAEAGLTNFYQIYDPLTWLETVGNFQQEHGINIDSGELITILTGRDENALGVYTIKKVVTEEKAGLEVTQDGQLLYNYPMPVVKTAEQIVERIEMLRRNFGSFRIGNEFNFDQNNPKPLVATVKEGQNEIRLFSNGTITITGPGVMKIVTMADADASKANELMEQILDLTLKP
jgi:hypothetical protein